MDKTVFYKTEYSSPLGKLTICAKNNHLVGLWIEGQKSIIMNIPLKHYMNINAFG